MTTTFVKNSLDPTVSNHVEIEITFFSGANNFPNVWKRSRGDNEDQTGCFQRRMAGKLYTTEEYQIETTV
jgi:hypothetical protein